MITITDRYILKKFIGTFLYAILIMAIIASVIDYTEKVNAIVSKKVPAAEVFIYFRSFIPHIIALLFALFIFISTIFFTSRLAYKSEIIAILATGASFKRFLRPYVIGATLLCGLCLVANHWIVPLANKQRLAFEEKYVQSEVTISDRNVHLRLSPQLYVSVQSYDYVSHTGYDFTAEKIDTTLKERISAERIVYDSIRHTWHLYSVVLRRNDGLQEELKFLADLTVPYPFTPKDLRNDDDIKETLTTPELNRYIRQETLRGRENLNFYYIEQYRRTAQPAAGFILCIIGACISSKKIRGGSGLHLAAGILISAVYMMFLQFSTTFSTKAGLNPFVAVWIPNVPFAIIAWILYRRQMR